MNSMTTSKARGERKPRLLAPYPSYLHLYAEQIRSGKIIAGQRIKQAVRRFLKDFDDPELRIELSESDKRIRFIEHECKLYEAPFSGRPFKLELFQKAIIESIYAIKKWNPEARFGKGGWVRKYQDVLIVIARKNGKALAIDTPIPTPQGWRTMAELDVGDTVFAVDGTPSKIVRVSDIQHGHKCYEVTFEDGEKITADAEHIWTVQTKTSRSCARYRRSVNLTTEQMSQDYKGGRHGGQGMEYKYCIQCMVPEMRYKSITGIKPVESVPVKCIGIAHPSHLYLAGRRMTPTHNTPLVAAVSLSEFMCGEMGTKILYGSNDFEQADLAFSATDAMREESPSMAKRTRRNQKGIFFGNPKHRKTKGKYSYQNKGSIRKISAKGKNKEGRNIKVGVVDEVHEMEDDHLVMPIQQALSTQDEPLYFEITTEGFTEDGYLDHRLADAQKVLDGELDRPDWAIWWYSQDSEEEVWQDESSWQKSNPGIGVIKKWSYLRKQVEEAKSNPSQRAFVLAKDFNIKQNSSAAWLDEATITNPETFEPEMLRGQYYIGGLDFAETTDLCSARALFEDQQTKKKYTLQMYFIPEAKADAILDDDSQLNPERKNYREWEKQGFVVICPGAEVDAELVAGWFVDLYEHYGMMPYKIGYDNWHSKDFQEIIADNFGKEVLERIGMDFMSLSGPMRSLESDLARNVLVYNNNEIDRWCLSNTGYKTNNIGLIMPVKKYGTSKNRIDGTLSDIICYATFNRYRSLYRDAQKMR